MSDNAKYLILNYSCPLAVCGQVSLTKRDVLRIGFHGNQTSCWKSIQQTSGCISYVGTAIENRMNIPQITRIGAYQNVPGNVNSRWRMPDFASIAG